jgi:RNA polymerase sigma factor (sigma-70 family)
LRPFVGWRYTKPEGVVPVDERAHEWSADELVEALRAGDRVAMAHLYDRYASGIHDFCFGMTRNREDAADATQDTFVAAIQKIGALRDPERLRAWLFAIARHEVFRISRRRRGTIVTDELPEYASRDAGPDVEVEVAELQQLVWAAAGGLADRDRALLDLHVRQGLSGTELAAAVGVEPSHVYVMLNRLREQVQRSIGALLVARTGRADCADLDAIMGGAKVGQVELTPLLRKRVARHVDACEVCSERRARMVNPLALFGGVTPALAAVELRGLTLDAMQRSVGTPSSLRTDHDGFPRTPNGRRRGTTTAAVAAGVALLIGGGALVSGSLRSEDRTLRNASISTPPTGTPVPPRPSGSARPVLVASPTAGTPTTTATAVPTVTATSSDLPTATAEPSAGVVITGVRADADHLNAGGNCGGQRTTVHADVTPPSGYVATLHWDDYRYFAGTPHHVDSGSAVMTAGAPGEWLASFGDFAYAGQAYYSVTVTPADGAAEVTSQTYEIPVQSGCIS